MPVDRAARVIPPSIASEMGLSGIYRDQLAVMPPSALRMLRPGGVLTALAHRYGHVCVRYAPAERYGDQQCEVGAWFWMAAAEFIRMETRYRTLRALEEEERQLIIRLRHRV